MLVVALGVLSLIGQGQVTCHQRHGPDAEMAPHALLQQQQLQHPRHLPQQTPRQIQGCHQQDRLLHVCRSDPACPLDDQ